MELYDVKKLLSNGETIYDIPLRVTYYARVSTESDSQIHSLKSQEEFFDEFIKSKPNWTYMSGYSEEGISAKTAEKRGVFLRMIDDARAKKFDLILTKEISRFSRSTLDSIKYTQNLLSYGVGVVFLSDNINTLLPDSEVRLAIMASLAQDEIRKLSERVRFGFKRAVKNGVVLGNDRIWGYRKSKGKLVIDDDEAAIVRLIFKLYADEKMGLRKISTHLSERGLFNSNGHAFGCTAIGNVIKNLKYKGYYCAGKTKKNDYRLDVRSAVPESEWIIYKDEKNVPAIVSEEIWDRANAILKRRTMGDEREGGRRYAYSGKIRCGNDGKFYRREVYKYKTGERELWTCGMSADRGKAACNSPKLYTDDLDAIAKELALYAIEIAGIDASEMTRFYETILTNTDDGTDNHRKTIARIAAKKEKLLSLRLDDAITDSEFKTKNDKLNKELTAHESAAHAQISAAEAAAMDDVSTPALHANDSCNALGKIAAGIKSRLLFESAPLFSRELIDALIDNMTVRKSASDTVFLDVKSTFFEDATPCRIDIDGRKRTPFCSISSESYTT